MNEIKIKYKCTRLKNTPPRFMSFLEAQNANLLGNRVFVEVMS